MEVDNTLGASNVLPTAYRFWTRSIALPSRKKHKDKPKDSGYVYSQDAKRLVFA